MFRNCVEMTDSLLFAYCETKQQLEPFQFCFLLLLDEGTVSNSSHQCRGSHICILVCFTAI